MTSDLPKGGISSSSEQEFGLVRKSAIAVPTNEQLESNGADQVADEQMPESSLNEPVKN